MRYLDQGRQEHCALGKFSTMNFKYNMCIKTQIILKIHCGIICASKHRFTFRNANETAGITENHIAVSSMIIPHHLYYPNFEKCFELIFKPRSSFENLLCSFFLRLQQNFETELTLPSLCTSVLP